MAITDAIIISAICVAFIGYGLILAWGDYQTRNLDRGAGSGTKPKDNSGSRRSASRQGPTVVASDVREIAKS